MNFARLILCVVLSITMQASSVLAQTLTDPGGTANGNPPGGIAGTDQGQDFGGGTVPAGGDNGIGIGIATGDNGTPTVTGSGSGETDTAGSSTGPGTGGTGSGSGDTGTGGTGSSSGDTGTGAGVSGTGGTESGDTGTGTGGGGAGTVSVGSGSGDTGTVGAGNVSGDTGTGSTSIGSGDIGTSTGVTGTGVTSTGGTESGDTGSGTGADGAGNGTVGTGSGSGDSGMGGTVSTGSSSGDTGTSTGVTGTGVTSTGGTESGDTGTGTGGTGTSGTGTDGGDAGNGTVTVGTGSVSGDTGTGGTGSSSGDTGTGVTSTGGTGSGSGDSGTGGTVGIGGSSGYTGSTGIGLGDTGTSTGGTGTDGGGTGTGTGSTGTGSTGTGSTGTGSGSGDTDTGGGASDSGSGGGNPVDLYVLAGQSNMVGRVSLKSSAAIGQGLIPSPYKEALQAPVDWALQWNSGSDIPADTDAAAKRFGFKFIPFRAGYDPSNGRPGRWGPEVAFLYRRYQADPRPIYFVKYAIGGTAMFYSPTKVNWNVRAVGNFSLLSALQERVSRATDALLAKGFTQVNVRLLWGQGESDSGSMGQSYSQNFTVMFDQFSAGLTRDNVRVSIETMTLVANSSTRYAQANINIVANRRAARLVNVNAYSPSLFLSDNLHLGPQGQIKHGEDMELASRKWARVEPLLGVTAGAFAAVTAAPMAARQAPAAIQAATEVVVQAASSPVTRFTVGIPKKAGTIILWPTVANGSVGLEMTGETAGLVLDPLFGKLSITDLSAIRRGPRNLTIWRYSPDGVTSSAVIIDFK
jgi:hypothetical protein